MPASGVSAPRPSGRRYGNGMGLSQSERKAVTQQIAARYQRASRSAKRLILDDLCATTLLTLTTAKVAARAKPPLPKRASASEATTRATQAC